MARPIIQRQRRSTLSALVLAALGVFSGVASADTITRMTYDAGDHVTSVTDPRGLVTTYAYDGLGQLWQQTSPDTGTTNYGHDSYGRQASLTRANGVQTTYGYDGLNRMVSLSAGGQTQTFTYDNCTNGLGRLCSDSDAIGATSYSYTPEGWVAGRGFTMGSTSYALGYSYNALGQPTAVVYPDGNQALYSYIHGVVSGVTLTVGSTSVTEASVIRYSPMDRAMSMWTSSNGLVNTLNHDSDGRLYSIRVPGVQSLGFTFDNADRITGITNGIDGSLIQNFGYDDASRLISVFSSAHNESFHYDADGNRIAWTLNGASTSAGISATSNQVLNLSGANTAQYAYDPQGNLTTVSQTPTYHFDPFNRMDQANGTSYYVNAEGQRLRKTGGAGTTWFAPDASGALLAEDANGSWNDYIWLNGRLIGRISGGQVLAIHTDQLDRPEAMTDASQAIVWRADNLAFSRQVTQSSVAPLNLGFPGQYYDVEAKTWNNGFRDYSALLGRYIESDPIGLVGGVNTYAYVGGNPLSNVDPLGLCPKCSSKLPDGSTIGQHVRAVAAQANQWGSVLGPLAIAVITYNGTNFRKMYGGPGANYHFLGNAGNFAYGAVSADLWIPLSAAELVAGRYASVAHTPSDQAGPYGMDSSATENVPAGYDAECLKP